MSRQEELRTKILNLTKEYYSEVYGKQSQFVPGETFVHYGGRYFDEREMINLVDSSLEFWLTQGSWTRKFEKNFSKWLGVRFCSVTNSGSSANLLAFMALTAPELGRRQIRRGDEVITVACAFPTTVSPIIQYGAIPVFVDVTIPQYNVDVTCLEKAFSEKTKAVMLAHSLGNPFNLQVVREFCNRHDLWLIEDNCDSLGTEYRIDGKICKSGTIGDIGTSSFYPPHHITMGEGGAVYTNNPLLHRLVNSYRDWGRDCWCPSGVDNSCKHRFSGKFGELPVGYDHKYTYSHLGYNLKITDMQAAIGCAQLEKLDDVVASRRRNHAYLYENLSDIDSLIMPEAEPNSIPSWFGFMITVKSDAGFSRNDLTMFLEQQKIQTRNLFAGNLILHPAFDEMRRTCKGYRVVGELKNTDFVMNNSFWLGVYPGMTQPMLDYTIQTIRKFVCLKK